MSDRLLHARRRLTAALAAGCLCLLVTGPAALAADAQAPLAIDDLPPELVDQLKQQVLQELLDDGLLERQIDEGIQRYVRKRQADQAAAQKQRRRQAQSKAKSVRPVSAERDHVKGNPAAELSLIEYSDFECPYCKRFHVTASKALELYDGKVNWVYRHFPLRSHNPGAQRQAEASECAAELGGNAAFWQFTDAIYARTRSGGRGFQESALRPLAEELGLDGDAFEECLRSGRHAVRVKADLAEGGRAGVTGTPGNLLLNNRTGEVRVVSGAVPLSSLRQSIDAMLSGDAADSSAPDKGKDPG